MFVDCGDRALAARTHTADVRMTARRRAAFPELGERAAMMFNKEIPKSWPSPVHASMMPERGTTQFRTKTRECGQIVDEGANSNTHTDFWRKDALKKWARLGFTSYLKGATNNKFQWRRHEGEQWQVQAAMRTTSRRKSDDLARWIGLPRHARRKASIFVFTKCASQIGVQEGRERWNDHHAGLRGPEP